MIVSPHYSGDSTASYSYWMPMAANPLAGGEPVVGPGLVIDTNKYYVVFLDSLGLWGTSKPSEGLGRKFPQYSYFDMVQANYQLLRDHLNVANVHLALGASMGATQTWVWGAMYSPSGFVDAIMPIGGTTASDGSDPVGQWTFRLATAAIESDPLYRETGGNFYDLPKERAPQAGPAVPVVDSAADRLQLRRTARRSPGRMSSARCSTGSPRATRPPPGSRAR